LISSFFYSHKKQDIVDAMLERKVVVGEEIIKQGDEGDFFYLVDAGTFEILVRLREKRKIDRKRTELSHFFFSSSGQWKQGGRVQVGPVFWRIGFVVLSAQGCHCQGHL